MKTIKIFIYTILIILILTVIFNMLLFSPIVKNDLKGNNETVLVIGRHDYIMNNVIHKLKKHNYNAFGFTEDKQILDFISKNKVDAILIGGVEKESRQLFDATFKKVNPKMIIINSNPQSFLEDLSKKLKILNNNN